MEDNLIPGDLLFLTSAYELYLKNKYPKLKVRVVNRLAKLEDIIDWDTPKGKRIKEARVKSGKWKKLPLEENKYIISVYYHDLKGRKGEEGAIERGVPMFRYHPKSGVPFFQKVPDWIYQEIMKQCEEFDVELKEEESVSDG